MKIIVVGRTRGKAFLDWVEASNGLPTSNKVVLEVISSKEWVNLEGKKLQIFEKPAVYFHIKEVWSPPVQNIRDLNSLYQKFARTEL
ncbi:MAG: hypothetical protein HY399_08265 [Elusimicrobia bacterium]|nr:hypothetical protein [Elusimicrobiota bacterium]